MEEELIFLNALNRVPFLGPVRIEALVRHCGSARAAWHASAAELRRIPELKNFADKLARERQQVNPEKEWLRLQRLKVHCIAPADPAYPPLLKQIHRPPPLLYCRGRLPEPIFPAVAVVGSRRCTFYGRETAYRLARELAAAGLAVVSGLALGVDAAAHRGALAARGVTVAVLGCGIDICYPEANAGLMEEITAEGAVLSEFAPGTPPLPQHFPRRNRIISGLSLGTVVVEATEKSGALITARFALEQNREVFAVPGNVGSPYSRGCHRLLKEGARLVEDAADILEELSLGPVAGGAAASVERASLTEEERSLLETVPYRPLHMDELVRLSGLPPEQVGTLLLNLELKGYLRQWPGKYFCRV